MESCSLTLPTYQLLTDEIKEAYERNQSNAFTDVPRGKALQTHQDISGKENTITDLAAIRSGALLGTTHCRHTKTLVVKRTQ